MFRSFMRSTAPIALLLLLGVCALSAVMIVPASSSRVTDGVEITSGPDTETLVLVCSLLVIGVLAIVAAGFLTYRRRPGRR